jgi:polyphosphate kinase 2 (PPK2 family)
MQLPLAICLPRQPVIDLPRLLTRRIPMLDTIDLAVSLDQETYLAELEQEQARLKRLVKQVGKQQRPVVVVLEGWAASDRGSIIRRVTERLDPTGFTVHTLSLHPQNELSRHYLVQFWEHLPEQEHIAFFDGSWYTRVLVENFQGLWSPEEQERAYREINAFERQLVDFGSIIFKFWLHTGQDILLRRVEEGKLSPDEFWASADQDWLDAGRWDDYEKAVDDILLKTSTLNAPWVIVEANDKYWARVKTLKTLNTVLSRELLKPSRSLPGSAKSEKARKKKQK